MTDFSNPSSFVPFLRTHKLTLNQFFIISCLYLEKYGELQDYAKNVAKIKAQEIDDLIDRGFVIPSIGTRAEQLAALELMEVNEKFAASVFVNNYAAADEFWKAYPGFLEINGIRHNARNYPLEDFREYYAKIIANSKFKHEQMLTALKYAIDNKLLNMGLEKYFTTGYYMLMLTEMQTKASVKRVNHTKIL